MQEDTKEKGTSIKDSEAFPGILLLCVTVLSLILYALNLPSHGEKNKLLSAGKGLFSALIFLVKNSLKDLSSAFSYSSIVILFWVMNFLILPFDKELLIYFPTIAETKGRVITFKIILPKMFL